MDDARYRREVLEPARAAGDQPPEDLRVRYALPDPLDSAAVAARVKEVRQCWRRARGQLKYRKLIDKLEAEHRELAAVFAAAERGDLRPLDERLRGGEERTRRRSGQARARLADAAGMLRMVTPAEVEGIARTAGVSRSELAALAAEDRIEVREPDPLPGAAPYAAYRKVRESLDVLGLRHLADFVFGAARRAPMRVLDGFSCGGLALDAAAVAATSAEWARRGRDTSTTHADTVLAALRSGADLAELVRYDIVDRLRERSRQRASERGLLRHALEELGVESGDAHRLVFAVLRETAPGGGAAGRLRALLDGGEVHAAVQLADAADLGTAPPDGEDEAGLLAAEARRRLDTALRLREQAGGQDDPDRAWLLLADALALVRDLPGAVEHQRSLPPRPVPRVGADVDGAVVRLSWPPSPSTSGDVVYRVVRRSERPPRGPHDGEEVTGARDDRPPVNVPLFYGVVALRGDAASAPAVIGPVVVRPEPRDVALSGGDGLVVGRWRCPAEAVRAVVVREGRGVAADRDGFRERVPNGTAHHYRVCAVYLDGEGREVVTPGVRVSVTPSAPPEPVYDLSAEADPHDPGRLRVRFTAPRNGTPELVLVRASPPWPRSALVPVEEVREIARTLEATPTTDTSDSSLHSVSVKPPGSGWVLAVTVAQGTAAIGAYHRHVHLPPPRRLIAERRGAFVHLGFDWPPDVAEVELTCRSRGGTAEREIITRAGYETGGGIRVPVPEGEPVELSVAAAGLVGGALVTGPPVTAEVDARVLVGYEFERGGPPWRRSLTVRLTCTRPVRIRRLVLVRRAGKVMPHRPSDGETVADFESVPVPGEVTVEVPRGGPSGGSWLRCFAEDDGIDLRDPPVRHLRIPR